VEANEFSLVSTPPAVSFFVENGKDEPSDPSTTRQRVISA